MASRNERKTRQAQRTNRATSSKSKGSGKVQQPDPPVYAELVKKFGDPLKENKDGE